MTSKGKGFCSHFILHGNLTSKGNPCHFGLHIFPSERNDTRDIKGKD
uniref:Uncharacterized protein n=1 Tax=Rhizophora mucronata TaxID=61149 RepID=A0A2P2R019_RHIMU